MCGVSGGDTPSGTEKFLHPTTDAARDVRPHDRVVRCEERSHPRLELVVQAAGEGQGAERRVRAARLGVIDEQTRSDPAIRIAVDETQGQHALRRRIRLSAERRRERPPLAFSEVRYRGARTCSPDAPYDCVKLTSSPAGVFSNIGMSFP